MQNKSMGEMDDANKRSISAFHRTMDIITGILLITGQITVIGVFIRPERFSLTVGGPIFGGTRIVPKDNLAIEQDILDLINLVFAILLFSDNITVTGITFSSGDFGINISGPIFGYPKVVPSTLMLDNIKMFHSIVKEHYNVPPELLSNLIRDESDGQ